VSFRQTITRSKAPRAAAVSRMGNAEEVAFTILFLASDESSFTTGGESMVDGAKRAAAPRLARGRRGPNSSRFEEPPLGAHVGHASSGGVRAARPQTSEK
jgi:hypothetical protein